MRAALSMNQCSPRRWTPEEVALVEGIAAHCWAEVERARADEALSESEERMRLAISATRLVTFPE